MGSAKGITTKGEKSIPIIVKKPTQREYDRLSRQLNALGVVLRILARLDTPAKFKEACGGWVSLDKTTTEKTLQQLQTKIRKLTHHVGDELTELSEQGELENDDDPLI